MRTTVAWSDKVPERDGIKACVYDIAFKPDGTQLVAAVGSRVLVYDCAEGDLLHSLKGHKKTLYCVAYSKDGKRFASGSEDKNIIIWTAKAEGILKYSHNDSIQCLAYNAVSQQLASGTASDFGLWSPEQKSVAKHKVSSRILCISWTNDGTLLTLGHYDGKVSLRDKAGVEKLAIQRPAPVFSIEWNPSRDESPCLLAIGCWDQTLSFYDATGQQHGRDRQLQYDPCTVAHFENGEYLCVGGSDCKATLWTKEGVRLSPLAEREEWVWCCVPRPNANYVAVGCNDGTITMYQLVFSTVHGLYREKYAYREYMTDVVVQNMDSDVQMRIKCRAYVKRIAVYNNRLAVQLPDRLYLYELIEDGAEARYQVREKLAMPVECNQLVVVAQHFLLCVEKKLQLYTFAAVRVREWVLPSTIRYLKPVGGPPGREGLIVGCDDGMVCRIFIDNPFHVPLVQHHAAVRCLDLSMERDKLAVVDEHSVVSVYELATASKLFEEQNAEAVAWNTELPDMLCFSAHGTLSIKTGNFPLHQQKMEGVVVGFNGPRISALNYVNLHSVDVPQSASLYRYLEKREFAAAYRIACLGVTESDWRQLANEALKNLSLDIARRAFIRIRDTRFIELVARIEVERRQAGHDDQVLIATVLAHQGKFQEAAKLFCKANRVERAIDMFSDLRKWEEARQYAHTASAESSQELVRRQAAWAEQSNDMSAAYQTYISAGEYMKAIRILGSKGWIEPLAEVARTLSAGTHEAELRACLPHLEKGGATAQAKEIYLKLNDTEGLLELFLGAAQWDEALKLLDERPELAPKVYLPYGQWLIGKDRFEEAQAAFKSAGQAERSLELLRTLTHNAVLERRYHDAGQYLWSLAKETLAAAAERAPPETLREFERCRRTAEIYYAYHSIHKYTDEPFTALTPDTVFNISRMLLSGLLRDEAPYGVSKAYCLFALAKQARQLGAYKLARFALEQLQKFQVPFAWQEQVDLFALTIRARPPTDADELQSICFRCQAPNPLLNVAGDKCTACGHPFVRSHVNFELLPLVRFQPSRDMKQAEALALLRREPPPRQPKAKAVAENPWANDGPDVQTLSLAGDAEAAEGNANFDLDDPFTKAMLDFEPNGRFNPTTATREMLLQMDAGDVFCVQWGHPSKPFELYRNMLPDCPIVLCHGCNHFFHEEDWELATMSKAHCPFCRTAADSGDAGTVLSFPKGKPTAAPIG